MAETEIAMAAVSIHCLEETAALLVIHWAPRTLCMVSHSCGMFFVRRHQCGAASDAVCALASAPL
ncbi:hypothetical protein J6590_043992 [Homalodisca vitripennis]|nr:hypothetical protein J6590_043992 [Homalodisca vitripennis]